MTLKLAPTPLIAILRGIEPAEAETIAAVIVEAGFGAIEVPLNSPDPLASIGRIARRWGDRMLVGAGTVLTARDVDAVGAAGAALVVAPNVDPAVIERAVAVGLAMLPGVATVTEAFQALRAGASGLKLFPGEAIPPEAVRAWRAVLPVRLSSIRSAASRLSASALIGAPARTASASARRSISPARARRRSSARRTRS